MNRERAETHLRLLAEAELCHAPAGDAGEVMLYPAIVPPLDPGSAWIDVLAVGQSAEVRARLPLRWN